MSKYRKFIVCFIFFELLLFVCSDFLIQKELNKSVTKMHKVEISRIVKLLEEGESLEEIIKAKYRTIVNVEKFDPDKPCRNDYTVESVGGELYRFEYQKYQNKSVLRVFRCCFMLLIALTILLLIYIGRKILAPFVRMNSMTNELAKGNLSVPIKQEKSKYFHKFLWGMDMLREKIEDNKRNELALLKERKLLVLSLSHDIKTPLSAIDLYSKALKMNLYDSEEKKLEAISGIEKNIADIKRYVGEIANASREDFMSLSVENGEVYLSDITKEIEEYYRDKMKTLHIDFDIDKTEDCLVYGDRDRLVEVLQNIIENAIKYGDGERIAVSFSEEENCRLVTVTNTGGSLDEEELLHIFDSFYRGSNSSKESGSGLGLYICRELMHKMDGEVFASMGEEFSVTVVIRKLG